VVVGYITLGVEADACVVPFVGGGIGFVVFALQALNTAQNIVAIIKPADNHLFILIPP
jgi:hypothetical protein